MDKNEKQRVYRAENGNLCTKKYEKTKRGFLMRMYRNMTSRTLGIQKGKAHLYKGKEILSKEDFYAWANSAEFDTMFAIWEASDYNRKLTPTVDRVDSKLGYKEDNMRWLTHSENSRLGAISKNKTIYNGKVF